MKAVSKSLQAHEVKLASLLNGMQLGRAVRLLRRTGCAVDSAAVKSMALSYEAQAKLMQDAGQFGEAKRLARRAAALHALVVYGPKPAKMVAETELPAEYEGKILLVLLKGGGFKKKVCLRSGDSWHREILQNTRAAIADLGFIGTQVHPLGGAYAGCVENSGFLIWGSSDEFGACDKQLAAKLIAQAYPGTKVKVAL